MKIGGDGAFVVLLFLVFASGLAFAASLNGTIEKKYTISIASIFQDEEPYIKEWIEYHRIVGVDHFYLYNNGSVDGYKRVLQPYIQDGIVTLIDWPTQPGGGWCYRTQGPALVDACKRSAAETVWLALIDMDEFLLPMKDRSMTEVLKRYQQYPGVVLNWHMYGTSGLLSLPPNTLLIEALHRTAWRNTYDHYVGKSIVHPECFKEFNGVPHYCAYIDGKKAYTLEKNEARINHYVNRTIDYLQMKVEKKIKMEGRSPSVALIANRANEEEDRERVILRFVSELRRRLGMEPKGD